MSNYFKVEIEFKEPLVSDDCRLLASVLHEVGGLDVTSTGFSSFTEDLLIPVELLCDFAHYLGFPCRGRRGPDYSGDGPMSEWHNSRPDFTKNREYANFWHSTDAGLVKAVRAGLAVAFPIHSTSLLDARLYRHSTPSDVKTITYLENPPLWVALPK